MSENNKLKDSRIQTTVRLDPELHRLMALHCVNERLTHQDFLTMLIEKTLCPKDEGVLT